MEFTWGEACAETLRLLGTAPQCGAVQPDPALPAWRAALPAAGAIAALRLVSAVSWRKTACLTLAPQTVAEAVRTGLVRLPLSSLAPDFLSLGSRPALELASAQGKPLPLSGVRLAGPCLEARVPRTAPLAGASALFAYAARPPRFSAATPASQPVLPGHPGQALFPLGMAAVLAAPASPALAARWEALFEAALAALPTPGPEFGAASF